MKYKDDPTIMTWELANEPRCWRPGRYPRSENGCTSDTLTEWANDISTLVKCIDQNHLVSVGDEGFLCGTRRPPTSSTTAAPASTASASRSSRTSTSCATTSTRTTGATTPEWGNQWIKEHSKSADKIGKPAMLGEFGLQNKATRNTLYKQWPDTASESNGDGALYWILSDKLDDGTLVPGLRRLHRLLPEPRLHHDLQLRHPAGDRPEGVRPGR